VTRDVEPRRVPSTLGGLVYLLVVALSAVGLGLVALGPWRRGLALIGVALLVGAGMRATLPDGNAGMLRVRRNRWVDVLMLGGVGTALIVLSNVIPDQPG
jgi:predicted cobalt transporter CbtA